MRKISIRINSIFFVLILLLVAIFSAFLMSFAANSSMNKVDSDLQSDYTVKATSSIYKTFAHGSTYVFTDKDKVDAYRTGEIDSDLTQVIVDNSELHGSMKNPFVIDSLQDWNNFAADITAHKTDPDYSAKKYYVLSSDLDFADAAAPPLVNFYGNFFGLGHVVSNVKFEYVDKYNVFNWSGLFTSIGQGSVIADLSAKNYLIKSGGGLIGRVNDTTGAEINVLNCHTDGRVEIAAFHTLTGGIVGILWAGKLKIYRCSAKIGGTVNNQSSPCVGGIIGASYTYESDMVNQEIKVYDCYADVEAQCESLEIQVFTGALGAVMASDKLDVENFAGRCHIVNKKPFDVAAGGLMSTWFGSPVKNHLEWGLKNVYVESEYEYNDGLYKPFFVGVNNKWKDNITYNINTSTNLHMISDPAATKTSASRNQAIEMVPGFTQESGAIEDFWQSAKNDGAFKNNKVWDASKIGTKEAYEESPVKNNSLKTQDFECTYNNLVNGKAEPISGLSNIIYNYGSSVDLEVPPAMTNRKFLGWTTDKTGEGEFVKSLSADHYGDVTLYAVWDVEDPSTIKTDVVADKTEIEYGTGTIKLQGTINFSDMKNPKRIYRWYQDGELVFEGNYPVIERTDVKHSGNYELRYTIWDDSEPLWRHTGTAEQSVSINITKGKLTIKDFSIKEETPAYFGKLLKDIQFDIVVVNGNDEEVSGEASWLYETTRIQKEPKEYDIHFVPDNENYEVYDVNNPFKREVTPQFLKLTFKIDALHGNFSVEMEYKQYYSANNIRQMFKAGYKKFLDDNPGAQVAAENMTPKLDGVSVNDYDKDIAQFVDNMTIEVTLEEINYIVTFDARNSKPPTTLSRYYGNRIPKPTKPQNDAQVFLGWFWDKPTTDGGTESTEWDFDEDVVTMDITLYAKWLDVKFVLESITVEIVKKDFTALDMIMDGDLKVIAHLVSEDGEYTQDMELSWGDFTIEYPTADGKLHFDNPKIGIVYKYGTSEPVREDVILVVNKKQVDTSGLKFESKSYAVDGKVHKITVSGKLPDGIKGITYEYFNGSTSLGSSGVSEVGVYSVVATFEFINSDYTANSLTATLTINHGAEDARVEWEEPKFTYNGKEQVPVVHIYDKDDAEITENMSYEFELVNGDKISAGSHTIKIVSDDTGYKLTGDLEYTYKIAKKELSDPVFEGELVYNGEDQFVEEFILGFDAKAMLLSGDIKAVNAGDYRVTITLQDKNNYSWSKTSITITWKIQKLRVTADWDTFEFLFDNTEHSPRVKGLIGAVESDLAHIDFENDFVYSLPPQINVGSYTTFVEFNSDADWTENYILEGNTEWSYVIVPKKGMTIISIEWSDTDLVYNKNIQAPTFVVKDKDGNDITDTVKKYLVLGGDYKTSKWEGDYEINVTLKDEANGKYFIRQGAICKYHISADGTGAGGMTDPDNPNNPNNKPDDDKNGGFKLPENFPLWQVIAGGITLILGIVFFAKAGVNDSKRRKFKAKTKAVQKSYSVVVTPLILLGAAYLGLEQNIWTIIACSLIGFCVIGFVTMLGTGHSLKKAEAGYEKAVEDKKAHEDALIAQRNAELERKREEEQQRRDEEQRKRDEEMKMMFMAMMNNKGATGPSEGGGVYTGPAIEEIVAKTVAALMPSMQTLMISDRSSVDNETMTKLLKQQEKLIEKLMENQAVASTSNRFVDDDDDEEDEDDEEMSWDEESDEEEIEEITPVEMVTPTGEITMTEAIVKKTIKLPANFRARLKISSDKNREAYVTLKNHLCSKRGITFRVSGRVEKIKYKGELICAIGVATKHLKLWFALDVDAFDKRRYFQKDVSDKPRYAQVPMLVKVGSERAIARAIELIDALCEKFDIANKRKYTEKNLQVLAYTLKHNALLKAKMTDLLCDSIHVHDADVMSDEDALDSVERRIVAPLEEENFATIKLDDIDKAFVDGQKVTLDALKKKGLVSEDCNGYKVASGTRLTKPLIIIANEFTTAAAKMIVLTGGRAILLLQSED